MITAMQASRINTSTDLFAARKLIASSFSAICLCKSDVDKLLAALSKIDGVLASLIINGPIEEETA